MKFCVLAYPRVASTLLVYTIGHHLRDHCGLEKWQILNECFGPSEHRRLIEKDGHLENFELSEPAPDSEVQLREERCDLMRKYMHQDYVIKVLAADMMNQSVVSFMEESDYSVFSIERRDPYAALLSALVAAEHDYWNQNQHDNSKQEYHEFDASMKTAIHMGKSILHFQYIKTWMPIKKSFFFEDIITMKPCEILQSVGLDAEDDGKPHATKKLLGADNASLIRNLDEVREYYETHVVPYLNTQS